MTDLFPLTEEGFQHAKAWLLARQLFDRALDKGLDSFSIVIFANKLKTRFSTLGTAPGFS